MDAGAPQLPGPLALLECLETTWEDARLQTSLRHLGPIASFAANPQI